MRHQTFNISDILPSMYGIAGAVVVPSILSQTADLPQLQPYGLLGELVRIGAISAVFAAFV